VCQRSTLYRLQLSQSNQPLIALLQEAAQQIGEASLSVPHQAMLFIFLLITILLIFKKDLRSFKVFFEALVSVEELRILFIEAKLNAFFKKLSSDINRRRYN
jgi:hypothetical protein